MGPSSILSFRLLEQVSQEKHGSGQSDHVGDGSPVKENTTDEKSEHQR
jgi:hypothetical protein